VGVVGKIGHQGNDTTGSAVDISAVESRAFDDLAQTISQIPVFSLAIMDR
jgi:hypothetical protein